MEENTADSDARVVPTWIDDGLGSGSLSWTDAKANESAREGSHDGRAETETTMYADSDSNAPSTDSTWEELAALNDDMYHPERATQNHQADRRRYVEILGDELECTPYQKDQVQWILDDLGNIREFYPTASIQEVILCTISLVVDMDTTEFDNWIVRRDEFRELMDDLDMDMDRLWSIREKARQKTEMFD